ncbi:MAG: hypothetical protein KAR11_09015 [Phycisphaerae bacterium]|nr:hypothetical protein [Phycisphaerae bacterium]
MARVVRQRNNPPVLLIVFVFLFVIAAAVAVLMFMQRDEANKIIEADAKTKKQNVTDLAKLKSQNARIVTEIIGVKGKTTRAALDQIDTTYAILREGGHTDRGGVLPTLLLFQKKLEAQGKMEGKLTETIRALEAKISEKNAEINAQAKNHEVAIKKWADKHAQVDDDLKATNIRRSSDKTEAKKFSDGMLETARKEKTKLQDEREKLMEQAAKNEREIRRLKIQVAELKEKLNPTKGKGKVTADAKIIRVTDGVCFIGLGKKDKIKPGMTFSVFNKSDIGQEEPKSKGSLRVTKVAEGFCTCKIVKEDKDAPIVAGDVVLNPAYHTMRPTVFVIIGEYNLRGQGSTRAGAEELIAAVKHSGGKVEDDVTYRTDYLVMGEKPSLPSKPDELAPPAVHKAYERLKKKHNAYLASEAKAKAMRIPVLNLNRFLELTGYVPEKAPE